MRIRTSWLAVLLTAGMALGTGVSRGQEFNYAPPDPVAPLPLFSSRPEQGGFFFGGEFLLMRENVPLKNQVISVRGLTDVDGSITAALNGTQVVFPGGQVQIIPGPARPGTFIGSGTTALSADQLKGPQTWQPGFNITGGWRFANGVTIEASWWHLWEAKYAAVATLVPPGLNPGPLLADSFLFSPVVNFPNDYAGPANKVALGNPNAAYGIWNAASVETIQFVQRFDQWDLCGRIPIYQDDCNRCYGLIGPRAGWIWDRFSWRTVAQDFNGQSDPTGVAIYSNVISNRLYGFDVGGGNEWRLGDSPIGTFAVSLDLRAALFVDIVQEIAKYERGDFFTAAKRARNDFALVPELQAQLNLWWYPVEGVQLRVGYDAMAFFNTVSSPYPVDFNFASLSPGWRTGQTRYLDGMNAGIGFIF